MILNFVSQGDAGRDPGILGWSGSNVNFPTVDTTEKASAKSSSWCASKSYETKFSIPLHEFYSVCQTNG